jgi:hypothetical protein
VLKTAYYNYFIHSLSVHLTAIFPLDPIKSWYLSSRFSFSWSDPMFLRPYRRPFRHLPIQFQLPRFIPSVMRLYARWLPHSNIHCPIVKNKSRLVHCLVANDVQDETVDPSLWKTSRSIRVKWTSNPFLAVLDKPWNRFRIRELSGFPESVDTKTEIISASQRSLGEASFARNHNNFPRRSINSEQTIYNHISGTRRELTLSWLKIAVTAHVHLSQFQLFLARCLYTRSIS